jgi:hypothetical protein
MVIYDKLIRICQKENEAIGIRRDIGYWGDI